MAEAFTPGYPARMWALPLAIFSTLSLRLEPQVVHCLQQRVLDIADSAGMGKVDARDERVEVSSDGAEAQVSLVLAPLHKTLHNVLCCIDAKEAAVESPNTARLTLHPSKKPANARTSETSGRANAALRQHLNRVFLSDPAVMSATLFPARLAHKTCNVQYTK